MATNPKNNRNIDVVGHDNIAVASNASTVYVACNADKETTIAVAKGGEAVSVAVTADIFDTTSSVNTIISDLESANVNWIEVSSNTSDYFGGGDRGITGVKIDPPAPTSAAINYTITQRD